LSQSSSRILFGSYAKGTEKPLSYVNIAVILKEPSPEVEAEIGSLYSQEIDVVLFHRLPLHIQFEVLKYGKELFSRDDECLIEIKMKVLRDYLDTQWFYRRITQGVLK
jgi:hypothetical protein